MNSKGNVETMTFKRNVGRKSNGHLARNLNETLKGTLMEHSKWTLKQKHLDV